MSESPFSICMRFHSVLFAQTLGVPYVAIDYTGGGKIKGFLEGCGKEEARIDRADLADGDWRAVLESRLPAELRRAE
jgi:polysaccharide pyruvyl transferase WcaK-like protein